jgi:hypothetical protein
VSRKISITLDDEVLDFIDEQTTDPSNFINGVLKHEKHKSFMQTLAKACQDQSNDPDFLEEVSAWDVTVGDGLDT